ncbi:bile acid:sodium symporter family protein [Ilumatobacter sp.]|uniref:bile acid:sodium symporter family protein n=1 Tax=Ilumatobacter sp. TaxID=1967498 RepID=UPI003AF4A3D1
MQGEILDVILKVSLLAFVVSSMLGMGLSLTVPQIVEPLRSVRLVLISLAANFIAVPLIGWGIGELLSLDEGLSIGLTLMATAAGAPFLPKLAAAAKGSAAFSVGLMVLLMVVTVAYMPLVLPVLIDGVEVDPWAIASSLIFLMLLPLGIGLVVRARYEDMASGLQPLMTQISSVAIAALLVAGVIVNFDDIVDLIGTGGFAAIVLFLALSFVVGFVGGGSDLGIRSVLGLGTAQRNLSAALVVAGQNFNDTPGVLTFIIVAGIVGLVLLMPAAGEIGRRATES